MPIRHEKPIIYQKNIQKTHTDKKKDDLYSEGHSVSQSNSALERNEKNKMKIKRKKKKMKIKKKKMKISKVKLLNCI